jgi:hypothetical protein
MNGRIDPIDTVVADLLATFRRELRAQTRIIVFGMVSVVLIMSTLCFALARFT